MRSSRILVISLILAIPLFLTALFTYDNFVNIIKPNIPKVRYTDTAISGEFNDSIIFAFAIAFIPVAAALSWKYGQIRRPGKRLASIVLILLSIVVFFMGRLIYIQYDISQIKAAAEASEGHDSSYVEVITNDFNVEWYMIMGLCVGTFVSFVTLRKGVSDSRR